jgi:hypothetical protein
MTEVALRSGHDPSLRPGWQMFNLSGKDHAGTAPEVSLVDSISVRAEEQRSQMVG